MIVFTLPQILRANPSLLHANAGGLRANSLVLHANAGGLHANCYWMLLAPPNPGVHASHTILGNVW